MVVDLKLLKDIINDRVVEPMDHRHLNHEVPPFDRVIPTLENLAARYLDTGWSRRSVSTMRDCRISGCMRRRICTSTTSGGAASDDHPRLPVCGIAPASSPHLSDAENAELYGKCNNPYGHGHDYVLHVSVAGEPDPSTGRIVDIGALDRYVQSGLLSIYRPQGPESRMCQDSPACRQRRTWRWTVTGGCELTGRLHPQSLGRVLIQETGRNSVELRKAN